MINFDKIINCPKSGGDLCFQTQVNPNIITYLSLSCGFWSNSIMKEDSDFYNEQLKLLPELYKDLAWEDPETGLIWLPNIINQESLGMIFADGSGINEWKWAAVKAIKLGKKDKKINKNQTHRMDMKTIKHFDERDYLEALSYINIIP